MASELDLASGIIGVIAKLVELAVKASGKTTTEVLAEAEADCAKRAKSAADESDKARAEIEADLPGVSDR